MYKPLVQNLYLHIKNGFEQSSRIKTLLATIVGKDTKPQNQDRHTSAQNIKHTVTQNQINFELWRNTIMFSITRG